MSLLDLLALYAVVGAGCAVVVYRRGRGGRARRVASAGLGLALWPLWAPVVLIPDPIPRASSARRGVARVEAELEQALRAAEGSAFEVLLSRASAERIRDELRQAHARLSELDVVLAQPGFDLDEADARVAELAQGGHRRALRSAVLHRDNVARIASLRARQHRALDELAELVGALRSQLVLARYAGSAPEGVGGIVAELWARVEGLGEAMEAVEAVDVAHSAHSAQVAHSAPRAE
ncbi:MAG: hypothetical protein KF901_17945 [Myxococcales bacterium]|nr:hypothetical protein [Myxococcales bacterium]